MSGEWRAKFGDRLGYDLAFAFLESARDLAIAEVGRQMGLSQNQSLAIHAYTFAMRGARIPPFGALNSYLRSGSQGDAFFDSLVEDIVTAAAKMPIFEGLVYRKVTIPDGIRRLIAAGAEFRDTAFLSASTRPDVFEGRDIMLIEARRGRMISRLSAYPDEHEILFVPGTRFAVENVERVGRGLLIEMAEQ